MVQLIYIHYLLVLLGRVGLLSRRLRDGHHCHHLQVSASNPLQMNAREVQEKADQLQGVSTVSALVAGFGLTSLLQFGVSSYVVV